MSRQCNINAVKYESLVPMFIGEKSCKSGHSFGPAVRSHWLLHYVVSGTGVYSVGGKTYTVESGRAFLIKPNEITVYTADRQNPWRYVWVAFGGEAQALKDMPYIIENEKLKNLMNEIIRDFDFSENSDLYAATLIWRVINCILGDGFENNRQSISVMAKDIIKKQYAKELNVNILSSALGLNRSYFSDIFKNETGITPSEYIKKYRMEKAAELLMQNRFSVSVIAASVGFSDQFTFSRAFKNYYGVSPKKYHGNQIKPKRA